MKAVAVLVLACALAGCGGGRGHGTATLWVTTDRGARVLYAGNVPAGLTAMQALVRRLHVTTRYGGRFVQSISGVEGSADAQRDWFYFVNGVEADRGATEVRLHPGDVEWWDYRSWQRAMSVPVVVGAWPKPVDGRATVVAADAAARPAAKLLARAIHAPRGDPRDRVTVTTRPVVFHGGEEASGRIWFVIDARDAVRLARDPRLARFRYEGLR